MKTSKIFLFFFMMFFLASTFLFFTACGGSSSGGSDDQDAVEITITSPQNKYYTNSPTLSYTLSGNADVKYYLNNVEVNLQNNATLPNSVTGINDLQITATDSSGNQSTAEVNYFLNDLELTDEDNFNRPDNDDIGLGVEDGWFEVEDSATDTSIAQIANNKLVAKGSSDTSLYAVAANSLEYPVNKNIQIIDIIKLVNNESSILLAYYNLNSAGRSSGIQLSLEKNSNTRYTLLIFEWDIPQENNPITHEIVKKDINSNLLESAKKILFYRNLDSYYGLILDADNNIIDSIEVNNYGYQWSSGEFTGRSLSLDPFDDTNDTSILIEADNYKYYSNISQNKFTATWFFLHWSDDTYYLGLNLKDPMARATSVTVSGDGITGSLTGTYNASNGEWNMGGASFPSTPSVPLTYNFVINTASGAVYKSITVSRFLNVSVPIYPVSSSTGVPATGFTFLWSPVDNAGNNTISYTVTISDGIDTIWQSSSTTSNSIIYDGIPLSSGIYIYYIDASTLTGVGYISSQCTESFIIP